VGECREDREYPFAVSGNASLIAPITDTEEKPWPSPSIRTKYAMTGENSFIRSPPMAEKTPSRVSHWRVLWCPAGAGHAMFLQSPLIENRVQVYSDNLAVARWLQRTIETLLCPPFADVALPVLPRSSRAQAIRTRRPWKRSIRRSTASC
jgi:hypothetical protein